MTWNNKLTNIYKLASLHSWINQIDQMIIDFIADITDIDEINIFLLKELNSDHLTTEHDIVSLVLLNYFNYPVLKIIDLANKKLYGKITKNDIDFLKKHLFSGVFPLSSDLSYDITNRSFLSPKKAIKKAMKIDTVISKENPALTVLYMCFIISRIDMNEENRAMVAFLLLRIDMDLPPGLQQRVYKYLWEYKDIIQELLNEESAEKGTVPVVLNNIQSIQEEIPSVQIIKKNEESKTEDISENLLNEKINANLQNKAQETDDKRKNIKNTVDRNKETAAHADDNLDNNSISEKNVPVTMVKVKKNDVITTETSKNNSVIPKILSKNKNKLQTNLKSDNSKSPSKPKISLNNSFTGIEEQSSSFIEESNNPDSNENEGNYERDKKLQNSEADNKDKSDSSDSKNWSITLKNNKEILQSILNGIFKKKSFVNNFSKVTKNSSGTPKSVLTNSFSSKIGKRKYFFIGLGFSIILGFLIFGAVEKNTNASKAKIITKTESVDPTVSNSVISQENSPLIKSNIPEDFPFNIIIEGKHLVWKVEKGNSISGLFYALKDFKLRLTGTPLEKLSNMDWKAFFLDFKKNNPKRTSYHIIYPSETFVLSLN